MGCGNDRVDLNDREWVVRKVQNTKVGLTEVRIKIDETRVNRDGELKDETEETDEG